VFLSRPERYLTENLLGPSLELLLSTAAVIHHSSSPSAHFIHSWDIWRNVRRQSRRTSYFVTSDAKWGDLTSPFIAEARLLGLKDYQICYVRSSVYASNEQVSDFNWNAASLQLW
jgi:hypothetical protein